MAIIRFFVNNSIVKVVGDITAHGAIQKCLSWTIANHKDIAYRQYKITGEKSWLQWQGIKSMYSLKDKTFLKGLLPAIKAKFMKADMPFEVIDERTHPAKPTVPAVVTLFDKTAGSIKFRDYQLKGMQDFIKNSCGTKKAGAAGGNKLVLMALASLLNAPKFYLVHFIVLLHQTALGLNEGPLKRNCIFIIIIVGLSRFNFITIATGQKIIFAMYKKDPHCLYEKLNKFGFLIIDEAHRTGASQFNETAKLCTNAFWRLALTATPFMQGEHENDLLLMGTAGPVITDVTNSELIEAGVLARPFFTFFEVNKPADIAWLTDWQDIYNNGIVNNVQRNELIVKQSKKLIEQGRKPLCIVYRVKHGNMLAKMFASEGIRHKFVKGADDSTERKQALDELAAGKIDIIISTNIFDEGIDVREINALILASGMKGINAMFQRTGRVTMNRNFLFYEKYHATV